jgi:alpha-N-arabinofuranosidase
MKARLRIDPERVTGTIDRNIYGQFLSRRPGCAEGGLYDPAAPSADQDGIRADVSAAIAACRPTVIRWPGGCTGTSYHWLDGVGPVAARPCKIDLHFGWPVRYEFGTAEFIAWCRRIGAEPLLTFAMGTGTLEEAAAWVEYCNLNGDTFYAALRRAHGHAEPWGVRYWQLGNEMYGPWEIGYCHPAEYAAQAREWAKVIRRLDPRVRLVAVGGAADDSGQWAWEVVPAVAPWVDYIAFHTYWRSPGPPGADPWTWLLAGPHAAEQKIRQLAAIIDTVQRVAAAPGSGGARAWRTPRPLSIACTEWNTLPGTAFMESHPGLGSFRPSYHLHDALAVATFANIMQRHCRQITLATIAQSINVAGLVMVDAQGMWREPTYWAWHMVTNHSGPVALDAWVECDTFDSPERRLFHLPYLDASVTVDPAAGQLYLSLVNRHREQPLELEVRLFDAAVRAGGTAHVLFHDDPLAMNGPERPENVCWQSRPVHLEGSRFTYELLPHSYTILELPLARHSAPIEA